MRTNKKSVSRKQSYKSKKEKTKHKKNAHTKTYKNKLNYRKTKKNKTYNSKYNKKGGAVLNTIEAVNAKGYTLMQCVFLDNESKNFKRINDTNVTCIKVTDKGQSSGAYDKRFDDYWTNTGDNNQIVENVPADIKQKTFAYFDTHNSLTTVELEKLYTKLESGGKRICLWDWDRTISMEEGFQAHPTTTYTSLSDTLYEYTPFINNEIYNKHNEVENLNDIFFDYMDYMHNGDTDIYEGIYRLNDPINQKEYTNYLLGGKDRVAILKKIFSLENVKHCVISNNPSFDLTNKKNNKLLLIRAIFYEMGLNSEQNNNILLLHCGSKAVVNDGYTKPQFVNLVSSDLETQLIKPDEINNLRDLSDYRIYQLLSFLRNKETTQPQLRTSSSPPKPSEREPRPPTRSSSAPSKLSLLPPERVTSEE